jgi:hypothetical protein
MRGADVSSSQDRETATVTFDVVAHDASFSSVFIELASALLEDARRATNAREALTIILRRLHVWARFFAARGDGFSRAAELGLIGELLCLQALRSVVGLSRAAEAWVGPTGAPHDFLGGSGAVEVKLSTSAAPERFRITSARQLDDTPMPVLFLYATLAQEAPGGPVSLATLVRELRAALEADAPSVLARFEDNLVNAGYISTDEEDAHRIRLVVHQSALLRVSGEFPRIRPAELRPGVDAVSYEVPWSAIAPYRVPLETVTEAFQCRK